MKFCEFLRVFCEIYGSRVRVLIFATWTQKKYKKLASQPAYIMSENWTLQNDPIYVRFRTIRLGAAFIEEAEGAWELLDDAFAVCLRRINDARLSLRWRQRHLRQNAPDRELLILSAEQHLERNLVRLQSLIRQMDLLVDQAGEEELVEAAAVDAEVEEIVIEIPPRRQQPMRRQQSVRQICDDICNELFIGEFLDFDLSRIWNAKCAASQAVF